jgi:hypothetical protein
MNDQKKGKCNDVFSNPNEPVKLDIEITGYLNWNVGNKGIAF